MGQRNSVVLSIGELHLSKISPPSATDQAPLYNAVTLSANHAVNNMCPIRARAVGQSSVGQDASRLIENLMNFARVRRRARVIATTGGSTSHKSRPDGWKGGPRGRTMHACFRVPIAVSSP